MLDQLKQKLNPKKWLLLKRQKGQSLVEMAIATPLLLIMMLGVFEVGWALRGYIVLSNVNREAVRFAVKNGVLDYSVKNPATVGYHTVLSHTTASLARQLPLEFRDSPNATIIMSHIVADTGIPCAKYQGSTLKIPYEFDAANCNCAETNPTASQWFTRDDLVLHPGLPGYAYYAQTYGLPRTSRLGNGDYATLAQQVALANNQFNCNVLKTGGGGEMSINNMFIAEAFYDQPQIFGVPFISNRLTDPIPFYAHTAMRIVSSREADTTNTIGPTCEVYPITFHDGIFADPGNPQPGQIIDAYQGSGTGQFGWLTWNPASSYNNAGYAYEELINPRLSIHDFTDANDPNDHSLSIGDDVSSGPGVMNSSDVDDALEALVGRTIRVPIYNAGGGTGENTYYTISHFALITINQVCLPRNSCPGVSGNDKRIVATFVGYDDEACSESSGVGSGNSAPVADPDNRTVARNSSIDIDVLSNDNDPDGHALTITSVTEVSNPFKGTVSIINGGTAIRYASTNQTGVVEFDYTINDGHGGTATARVTVNVTAAGNQPPVAQNDSGYTTGPTVPLTVPAGSGVLANDTDPGGDSLTAILVSGPTSGSLNLNSDGSFTYTPSGVAGTVTFTYKANDGAADSNVATVTIVVSNTLPNAVNDSYTTNEDIPLTVNAPGVLSNDTDADGDSLTAIKLSNPANGTVTFNANGSFTYTPNANWYGSDSFTYKVNDGTADSANSATVTIIVNGVNDPPVAVNDSYSTAYNTTLTVNAASGVLANDTDIDTIVLTAVLVAGPANGSLNLNSNGSFTYTPTTGYYGSDSFTYKANDSLADSNVATVNITVIAPQLVTIAEHSFPANNWTSGSGWLAAWTTSGSADVSTTYYSSPRAMRLRTTGTATRAVDMTGVTGAQLVYMWRARSLESGESAEVQISDNGGSSWQTVQTISSSQADNTWYQNTVNLSGYSMVNNFQVRFKINGSATDDYFYIDDITITGYR